MSEIENYRAALQAKIDGMKRDRDQNLLLLDDTSKQQGLPTPSQEFIESHIGDFQPMSDAEIGMQAWQDMEQERSDRAAQDQRSKEAAWQTEKINTEFNRDLERQQAQARETAQEKEAQRQRDLAAEKTRQLEHDKETKRLAAERDRQAEEEQQQRQAAALTQAVRDKEQAAAKLEQQQQSASQDEISKNRLLFQEAAARMKSVERDIE